MTVANDTYFWRQIISRLLNGSGNKIEIPSDFATRQLKINELLDSDYTGIVRTVYEFMVGSASVPMNFVTDNSNLTAYLKDWANHKLNSDISLDIPKGLNALTTQYMRERWKSSFIALNIIWEKIDGLIVPSKMWVSDGGSIIVGGDSSVLNGKKYYLGTLDNQLKSSENHTILIRKPFNSWYEDYPTQYLVSKGVLYNALLKKELITKQADVIQEMIPYILALRAGDASLLAKNLMGDIDGQLSKVKESLKEAKRNKKYRVNEGDMILKGRYDLEVEHLIPDLTKLFNDAIVKPVNNDLLYGLGLVDLEGFASTRQESILNPKILVEEIVHGVSDFQALLTEVLDLMIEKNKELHPKQMGQDIRIVPGVIKTFLTDAMRKLIKDYTNTGLLSIEDAFEGLPQGFDFEISKKRRENEKDEGVEDLFFPRVILNQDSNTRQDVADPRPPSPNEVPSRNNEESSDEEDIMAPYTKENYPEQIKNLPQGARTIWIRTFNSVYEETKDEDKARQAAWSAVKNKYKKVGDKWVKKSSNEDSDNE